MTPSDFLPTTPTGAIAAVGGLLAAVGAVTLLYGALVKVPVKTRKPAPSALSSPKVIVGLVVALGISLATGYIALGIGAVGIYFFVGPLFTDHSINERVERLDALATWIEQLGSSLSGAMSLYQLIASCGDTAPIEIRPQVAVLSKRVGTPGVSLVEALWEFADEFADETVDLLVASLAGAATASGGQLSNTLDLLGRLARNEAEMQRRIATSQHSPRTDAKAGLLISVALFAGLMLLDRSFVSPFKTMVGQLVLGGIVGLFLLMSRLFVTTAQPIVPLRLWRPEEVEPTATADAMATEEV
ncbi:MAG: type II secretion system F family protein [Actinomycetota bacterium]|nr:type II secretion system F family protein [Actinomycetota bacterium]